MAEINTLYRLIPLYMLNKSRTPLSNAQITGFVLDKGYTSYFTVQRALCELLEAELVIAERSRNSTLYRITENGQNTIDLFSDKISDAIKADISLFLSENETELKQETSVLADYYRRPGGTYDVRCRIRSGETDAIDLTLNVPGVDQAEAVCRNWEAQHLDVYTALLELLIQ